MRLWDVATSTLRNTLEHSSWVNNVAFSPDSGTIATAGSTDSTARLWDTANGTLINTLTGHTNWVESVAFSPDGNTLASGSRDDTVRLWDTANGTLINTLTGHTDWVESVAFSPDGNTLASGSRDDTVRLWDTANGNLINTLTEHSGNVNSVAFSPDGNTLASGSNDDTVRLWDTANGTLINTLTGHNHWVDSVAFSPDGNTLASGSRGDTVRLWDVATGTLINTFTGHTKGVFSVAFSPDGNTLASGSQDDTVRLWDVATGTLINTLTGHTNTIYSVAFSPDGNTLASGDLDGIVLLWGQTPTPAPITFTPNTFDDQTFIVGTLVNITLPEATGGTPPYTYTLTAQVPAGLSFDETTRILSGTPTTATPATSATYTATDTTGASASLTFSIEVIEDGTGPGDDALDVNSDGQLNVLDLVLVAVFYGTQGDNIPADVNADGIVNVDDFAAVAAGVDAEGALPLQAVEAALLAAAAQAGDIKVIAEAPAAFETPQHTWFKNVAYYNVAAAFADVKHLAETGDPRLGKGIALLAELMQLLKEINAIPETTALLPNYPNPFNPETWIPYHLSKDADVTLTIHDVRGVLVRELTLGHQAAGVYESRTRAAYWDGRNQIGEKVASGLYFYTLTAGEFTATRKLLIAK